MNIYLILILTILVSMCILNITVEKLNIKHLKSDLPEEFENYYDPAKYQKSQEYLKETTRFNIITDTIYTSTTIVFIIMGGFNFFDRFARSFSFGEISTGLIFVGSILLVYEITHIPFAAYFTFIIEEKYGFNRTSVKTFIIDILKTWLLTAIIGGIMFSVVLWFFNKTGYWAWIYCWGAVILFQILFTFIAPVVIMPMFNKLVPLQEGELKKSIENCANSQNFMIKGIFTMDASKRSGKSNAFLTGFGKFRRIVLFDTLVEKHSIDELVSIVAHEIGHFKKKHLIKNIIISIITSGMMFFVLSFFINNNNLFAAFHMENRSIYASLLFFGFLYSPIDMIISVFSNIISRKNEYEADEFAVSACAKPDAMILSLVKLSVDNLSNLTPHPLKVFLTYSHPPVLNRIRRIKQNEIP